MPKNIRISADLASNLVVYAESISAYLPQPEQLPGRSAAPDDPSKWTMQELAEHIFMETSVNNGTLAIKENIPGTAQNISYFPTEVTAPLIPYLEELKRRTDTLKENPEYSSEKRPILNSFVETVNCRLEATLDGYDAEIKWSTHGQPSDASVKPVMDIEAPDTKGMNEEQRLAEIDRYEEDAKKNPVFAQIRAGFEQQRLISKHAREAEDESIPKDEEYEAEFNRQFKESTVKVYGALKDTDSYIDNKDFKLEDHPYMRVKTIENLKESRGNAASEKAGKLTEVLMDNGFTYDDMYPALAVFQTLKEPVFVAPDPVYAADPQKAEFYAIRKQLKDLSTSPGKLNELKGKLDENGIGLPAYLISLQDRMGEVASELDGRDDIIGDEKDLYSLTAAACADKSCYNASEKFRSVSEEEKQKARGIVNDMTAELLAGNKATERAGHMKELGMGDQLPHPAPEMKNVQMDGRSSSFLTNAAASKLAGWIGNKKAGYEQDALAVLNASSMSKQSVPKLFTNAFSAAVFPTDAVDIAGGKVFDSNKAVFDLAKKVNDDIENRLNSGKGVPEGTLQRAVLRNIQTFAQDVLLQDQDIPETDSFFVAANNGIWANFTEAGDGKGNLTIRQLEELNQSAPFSEVFDSLTNAHQVFVKSAVNAKNGIADPEYEEKLKNAYLEQLDRFDESAKKIISIPENERKKYEGFFEKSNRNRLNDDLFGDRGLGHSLGKTAKIREGIAKGWPVHVAAGTYHFIENAFEKNESNLQDLKPFIDEAAWNKAKDNLARIKEDFDKDLSGLSADEKAAHFLKLSKDMKEQDSFAGNLIKEEEARKKEWSTKPENKDKSDTDYPDYDKLSFLKRMQGGLFRSTQGISANLYTMSELMARAAYEQKKKAVALGEAEAGELAGFRPEYDKDRYDDAAHTYEKLGEINKKLLMRQEEYRAELEKLERLDDGSRSDEFNEMKTALKDVIGLTVENSPEEISKTLERLNTTSDAYYTKNSALFKGVLPKGRERKGISDKLAAMAKEDMDFMKSMTGKPDALEEPEYSGKELIVKARSSQRGLVTKKESLLSQINRQSDIMEANKLPTVRERKLVEGGLEGLKKKEGGVEPKKKEEHPIKRSKTFDAGQQHKEATMGKI